MATSHTWHDTYNARLTNEARYVVRTASREARDWKAVAWNNALERAGELVQDGYYRQARRVLEIAKEAR